MIALIGSHGTGKTTLLKYFKKAMPEYIVTDGSSRMVRSFNNEIENKLSPKEEQLLINRISDTQWPHEIRFKKTIQTRTPLDHYAYSLALGYNDYARERLELFKGSNYKSVTYFYIPVEFDLVDDGIRYTSPKFQEKIDSILRSLIEELDIPIVTLTGSVQERLSTLLKYI